MQEKLLAPPAGAAKTNEGAICNIHMQWQTKRQNGKDEPVKSITLFIDIFCKENVLLNMQKLGFGCVIIKKTASFAGNCNNSLKIAVNEGIACLQGVSGIKYVLPDDAVLFPESSMVNATLATLNTLETQQVSSYSMLQHIFTSR